MKKVTVITGPTASGKTEVCIRLSERFPVEIISADSRQIYKYMDIGTAKPTMEERKKVKHWLIDIIEPDERYSAFDFSRDCKSKVRDVRERNKIPLICGGTIFYIKSILDGMFPEPYIPSKLRKDVRRQIEKEGSQKMHKELKKIDPESARRIHPNDKQRIARAIEVYRASGIPMTDLWDRDNKNKIPLDINCIIPYKNEIYSNVRSRVEKMFKDGFINEVKELLKMGYEPSLYSFTSIGYREVAEYLMGEKDKNLEEIKAEVIKETKKYAGRQITFLKGLTDVKIYRSSSILMENMIEEFSE